MIELTPEAKNLRDKYLRQVRTYVSASGKADVEDVLREVEEHLDRELQSSPQPVSSSALKEVLERLGSPSHWIAEEDIPWWRRALLRARIGPEDWRLAYAAFGLVLLGILFGWIFSETVVVGGGMAGHVLVANDQGRGYVLEGGPDASRQSYSSSNHQFNTSAFAIFVIASFFLARAAMASAPFSQMASGQKWLVYPSLIMVYLVLAAAILVWASAAVGGGIFALAYVWLQHYPASILTLPDVWVRTIAQASNGAEATAILAGWLAAVLAGGIWWTLLSLLSLGRLGRLVQAIFRPFLDNSLRTIARVGLVVGLIVIVLSAAGFVVIWSVARPG